jgi:ankyrin repeat protein
MTNKRKHVTDENANIGSVTSSISKVQRPAIDAEVNSALFRYAENGDAEAMRPLLANGAEVDVRDEFGSTLL